MVHATNTEAVFRPRYIKMGNLVSRLVGLFRRSTPEPDQSSQLIPNDQEHTQKHDEESRHKEFKDLQPSQPSQHPPNNEQPREIGQQELHSKNAESIAQPNQAAVNQVHTVEEKEEKTLEQESKGDNDLDATKSLQTNQSSRQLSEKEQEPKTREQEIRRNDSDATESLKPGPSSPHLPEEEQKFKTAEQEPQSKDSNATESTAEPNQPVHAMSHLPGEIEYRTREQKPRRNEVSDPKVSTTEPVQSRRLLASKEIHVKAVEPKQQKLDKESSEKNDEQSSVKVVGKLNPSKDLNQEKVELQQLSEAVRMQAIGHQVVGSENKSHEEVKLMYERFFGGEAVKVKRELKKQMESIQARAVLHRIFQVIYDNVQQMLVEHLLQSPALVGEVLTDQNIKDQVGETKATDDRQRIFQAFKTRKIMAEADQGEQLKLAIESLFKVTDIFSSGGDANLQVEMRENQMAFGILLQTCGLIKGGNETKMRDMRKSLDESSVLSGIENFEDAKLLAKEHLDTYINGGIRLAWMMVTRIPPMIATEPKKHDPRFTILEACCDEDDACILVPLRPTLFFSYEGQVAAEGIVGTFPSKKLNAKAKTLQEAKRTS